jgi:hypothetical protein
MRRRRKPAILTSPTSPFSTGLMRRPPKASVLIEENLIKEFGASVKTPEFGYY